MYLLEQKTEGLGVHDLLAKGVKTNSSRSILEVLILQGLYHFSPTRTRHMGVNA